MATCDAHLSEGMSHLPGQPAPEHWRVFPLHEGSPPYCAVTCPTCHSTPPQIHIQRIEVHADDFDRLAFGLVHAFTRKITGQMAIPTDFGPLTIKSDPTVPPGEVRWVQMGTVSQTMPVVYEEIGDVPTPDPVLIDGLTPEQCRERWEANAAAIESGMARPYALSPDQIAVGKRLHLEERHATQAETIRSYQLDKANHEAMAALNAADRQSDDDQIYGG